MCYLLIVFTVGLTVANANGWFTVPTVCLCACWTFTILDWISVQTRLTSEE